MLINRRTTSSLLVALGAISALIVGCDQPFSRAPVAGRVTLDGQPLRAARVAFEPIAEANEVLAGPGSYGTTDDQGRFTLQTIDGKPGAVVGKHRVSISTAVAPPRGPSGEDREPAQEQVPQRYLDGTTPLDFSVPPAGTGAANFDLQSR